LLQHLPGKLLVIWDGASVHHGETVKAFLRAGGAARLHLERLPGYAPDLNPAEGLWRLVKPRELKNLVCDARWEVRLEFRQALARLRHRPDLLRAGIAHAGYSLQSMAGGFIEAKSSPEVPSLAPLDLAGFRSQQETYNASG